MKQLALDFSFEPEYHNDDYLITCANLEAYRAINNPAVWPDGRLLIIGAKGSGKTHLASIFANLNNAAFLKENQNFHNLAATFFIYEDIEKTREEEYLFHLINYARQHNKTLLLTASKYTDFSIPDLKSRINSTLKVLIKNPDDELLGILLSKQLSDRQLKITKENLNYLITHSERSFEFVSEFCDKLDKLSLKAKAKPSLKIIKQVLTGMRSNSSYYL